MTINRNIPNKHKNRYTLYVHINRFELLIWKDEYNYVVLVRQTVQFLSVRPPKRRIPHSLVIHYSWVINRGNCSTFDLLFHLYLSLYGSFMLCDTEYIIKYMKLLCRPGLRYLPIFVRWWAIDTFNSFFFFYWKPSLIFLLMA